MTPPANSAALENILRDLNTNTRLLTQAIAKATGQHETLTSEVVNLVNLLAGRDAGEWPPTTLQADPIPTFARHAVASAATLWLLEAFCGMVDGGQLDAFPDFRQQAIGKLLTAFDVRAYDDLIAAAHPGTTITPVPEAEGPAAVPSHDPCALCAHPDTRTETLHLVRLDVIGGIGPSSPEALAICGNCARKLDAPGATLPIASKPHLAVAKRPR